MSPSTSASSSKLLDPMGHPAPAPVYYTKRLRDYVKELWRRREFIWFLAMGNFKARNASTALGLFWWVLNPVLLSLVYWLVFGFIFPSARDIIYLMSGMFVFHFTAQALTGGANAVLQNSKLLTNIKFPRLILPLANLLESLIGFSVSLGVLLVVQAIMRQHIPTGSIWLLFVAVPLQFLFNLGLGSITARLAVPFRDINNFIPYVNRIWLYMSPIIWPLSMLETTRGEQFAPFAEFNPIFQLISVYRAALTAVVDDQGVVIGPSPFDPAMLGGFAIWAVVVGLIGIGLFVRYEGNIARHL
jgi:teichoic acid transport system permease protein